MSTSLISNILGFFWCERDSCIPSSVAKKYKVSFWFYRVTFERSYAYDTHTDMYLVSPTTGLTHALYNLFRKLLFSHFHTESLFRPGNISKNSREWRRNRTSYPYQGATLRRGVEPLSPNTQKRYYLNLLYYNIRIKPYTKQPFNCNNL